ncbi:MAG: N-acetylmuramoyl-L-alanine amidase [Deltaproteobacteria bacterium]|jgi:N-acetylmuramoyl-L-alanine amidase|nr:N-acetylmuramoyl-L-alanine amidase [Deltaproteobacteria bacterium]
MFRAYSSFYARLRVYGATLLCLILLAGGAGGLEKASASTQQENLHRTIQDFEALRRDTQRGMRRDSWEKMDKRFADIQKQSPAFAAEAFFYRARSLEELGDRSKNAKDYRAAAGLYADFSVKYAEHPLADNALFNQAILLSGPLRDRPEALKALDRLLRLYPKGDMHSEAAALRERLQASAPPPVQPPAPAQPPAPGKTSGSNGDKNTRPPASGALLSYLEWSGDSAEFLLSIGFAGRAKYRRDTLPPEPAQRLPARVRLDLLNTSPAANLRRNITFTGTPLTAINISQPAGGITRLELDLGGARSYKVSVLDNPYRLQVRFSAEQVLPGAEDLFSLARGVRRAAPSNGNLGEQLGLVVKTVLIDAGHGGRDPGAVGNGLREADITLKLADSLGNILKKQGFNVIYTRNGDYYVPLEDRTSLANNKKADLFISIHVNSSTNKDASGLETYYLDVARSDAAALVAARENSVNVNNTSDLQFILSDLARNGKKEESMAVARLLQQASLKKVRQAGFRIRDNGVRSAIFHVLMGARMPACLIEIGYLSNSADVARLKNPRYIQALAEGISAGIVEYRARIGALNNL